MELKVKHRIIAVVAATIICLVVIYLNLLSHKETQKIYLEQTEKIILSQKKDFLKDTINNILAEIDRLRETKYNSYKKNTEARLKRFQEELHLDDEEFTKFFINRFVDDSNPKMWTALLWNSETGEVLYNSYELSTKDINDIVEELKSVLSSTAVIKKDNIEGIFGVSKFYIDELIKKEVEELIRSRKFSNDSYIWVNEVVNYEGGKDYAVRRVHPNLSDTEGMYLSTDIQDIKGNLPYLEELEGIKRDGELFSNYYFKKPNSTVISEKITYAKLYKDYDWIIAMGVHLDDIDEYTEKVNSDINTLANKSIVRLLRYISIVLLIGFVALYLIEKRNLLTSTRSLETEMNLDTLTKASSRRYGEMNLKSFFNQYGLTGDSPAIMMFDIDNFKHINDKYGHNVGDIVLIEIVRIIQRIIRSSDQLIRWGGDEFVGIFLGLREEHIMEFGEKLLEEISSLKVPVGSEYINITVSVGFSYFKDTDCEYNDALKRADEALYKSKKQKNTVSIL